MSFSHHPSTPLVALEAVAIDTETTGLDARMARVVEIAVLKIRGEQILAERPFETLIHPGTAVPPASSRIHGLTDADLVGAPRFAAIATDLDIFIGRATVIGHDVGYDLAVLSREYALAGRDWRMPRALDVGTLARIAAPSLARYSLDALCDWQQIAIERRHRAGADAKATAELFVRLIPLLRARNIRTLAEAETACAGVTNGWPERVPAGWVVPGSGLATDPAPVLARLDSYPFRHRVRDVMSAPAVIVDGKLSPQEVLEILLEKRIGSVLVAAADRRVGIVTERDLLGAFRKKGAADPPSRIDAIMSYALQRIPEEAFLYRAIGRLDRTGARHLAVHNHCDEIVGIVSSNDLLRQRATTAIALGDEIDAAGSAAELGAAWAKLPWVVRSLLEEGVDPEDVSQVISAEICALTARAAQIAEHQMAAAGKGAPPVPYAVMVLGSGGRGESLLSADQDNAMVYAHGDPGGLADRWFEALAGPMADMLDQIGVPYCRGGVMAKNASCRHSIAAWKKEIDSWVERTEPAGFLNIDIFFDGVAVHGDLALGEGIFRYAYERAASTPYFSLALSALARDWRPPLTVFGGFRKDERGRVDLKKGGLLPIFTAARILAIRHAVRERSTAARLRAVAVSANIPTEHIDAIIGAHRVLLRAMIEQQLIDIAHGIPPTGSIEIKRLSRAQRKELHDALVTINLLNLILA